MNDVEYILRIILKARDEMAAVLAKARTQLRGFAKDSDTMNVAVTNLNQAMKNFDTNMEGVTKKLEGWRAILKDAGDESKKTRKSVDDLGKSVDKTAKTTKQAADTQKQLQDRARGLRDEIKAVAKAHEEGNITTELALSKYKKLGKGLDEISLKMSEAARKRTPAHLWVDDAEAAATRLKNIDKTNLEDAKRNAAEQKSLLDDINRAVSEHVKKREAAEKATTEINKAESADRMRIANAEIDALVKRQTEQERAARDAATEVTRIENKAAAEREAQNKRWDNLRVQARERMNQRQRLGKQRLGDDADPSEIRRLAAEYDKLARSYRVGSSRANEFGREAERLRTVIRRTSGDTDKATSVFDRLDKALSKSHGSAAGFDNQLRGIGILAAVASIDQLISAAIALGGELVSLAGSAVMAGGALGGILAAGASQALPVLGLLAGAAMRVKSVMDAVNAQQLLQKAQFTDAEKGSQKAIDKTNALANANDTVADANDRLAESRKALTDAQKEGVDQLQDLILAEKQAGLAARGAALDVKAAQEALRLAIRGGASQLEIDQKRQAVDEAKLSQTQANVGARRATVERRAAGGKVGNLDSVKSAAKAVDDAEKAVKRANRGLDEAASKADRAAGSTMTAAANLNFLLSQLSPAERRLYEAGTHLYDAYKKIFQGTGTGGSGIYGVIIDSFTRAVEKVEKIMEMPKVIAGIQGLADVIGENINKIVDAVDPAVIEQLLTIIGDAGDNLGPLVDMVIKLAKAFLNISETANPAFQDLIKFIGPIVDKLLALTSNKDKMEDFFKTGEDHLESWLNLLFAVIDLFVVLTGASAGSGKKSVEDLTKTIKGWTDWLRDHKKEVVGFFEDARKASYAIGGVLANIAVVLGKSFSGDRVEKFADILNQIVVPALGDFVDLVGNITDGISKMLENPLIAQVAKWGIAFLFLSKLAGPIVGVFAGALKSVIGFGKGLYDLGKGATVAIKWLAELGTHLETAVTWLIRIRPLLMAAFTGPVAIIAAVVIGVGLLLNHFGKLDDIWNAIKDAAKEFMKDIEPALKSLSDAFDDMGIKMDSMQDVVAALEFIGKQLANFISVYLIETIKGLGKVVAGVAIIIIRVITGVVNIVHGFADVIIGIVKLIAAVFGFGDKSEAGQQILAGFENLIKGILIIVGGIIEGLIKVFEGIVKIFLAPFKAAWKAVKDFLEIGSPSKKFTRLAKNIVEGIKDGLAGLFHALTWPYRKAWNAVNDFFDGKPKKLAEKIMDEFVDRMRVLWRRVRNAASFLWDKFKEAWDAAKKFGGTVVSAIVDGVKGLPAALLKAITDIGSQLIDVGKAIGNKIVDGIKSVAGGIKSLFGGGDDKDKPKTQATAPQKPTVSFDIGVGAIPFGAKNLKDAQNIYGDFWKELRRTARDSTDYIQRQFREMRISTSTSSDRMYRDVRGSLRDIQNSFKVRGQAATDNWSKTWLDFEKVAYDGLNYIGHETNKALKSFGAKHIDFGLSVPTGGGKGGEGKAVGGWIGNKGERGRDTVPAWLGRGEAVLNWAHQRVVEPAMNAMYGFGLDGLFSGTRAFHATPTGNGRGFAEGGSTDTRLSKLISAANRVDALHLPYVWGGGHTQPAAIGHGMDCSGSVSYVVQQAGYKVPTVTSGNMPSWGFPSGGDGATVFYNPEHTFMRIGSKFFGTTGFGHPGWTGAGWFTQQPSADYLSGFSQIHLPGITDVGGFAVGVGGEIAKLIVKGAKGAAKTLMQKAFDKVVPAANKFIGKQSSQFGAGSGQWGDVTTVPAGAENIFKFFREHGFSDEQSAGWIGNLTQESGLNPGIIQPNGEGHGLAQWGHGRFDALVAFAKAHGSGDWRDLGTQLQFILYELSGSESAAGAAIRAAGSVQAAVDAIGLKYERFGVAGNRSGPAEAAFRRFGGKFAEGGTVPGPDGAPTPILAHAGEWVLNKVQQSKLANWLGTSIDSVRGAFGFSGGPTAYAGGGEVRKRQLKTAGKIVTTTAKDLDDDLIQTVAESLSDLRGVMRAATKIKKLTKSVQPIIDLIELSTKEGGFLDQLRGSIEKQFARTALRLRQQTYKIKDGVVTQVKSRDTDVERARFALRAVRGQRDELTDERSDIRAELKLVTKRLADKKIKGDARKKLMAQQVDLTNRVADADERVQQNEEDIYNAQEELARAREEAAQKRKDAFQATVDKIKERFTKAGAGIERAKRIAAALANPALIEQTNNAVADNIQKNITALQGALSKAKAKGYTDIAGDIAEEIAELETQVIELAQQRLRDAMDAISTAASRRGTVLDLFGRMADAMGVVGQNVQAAIPGVPGAIGTGLGAKSRAEVAQGRISSARTEQAGYVGLLGQANAAGNVGLAQELTDKINELTVVIAENTKSARDARFAATQESFDYTSSINDLTTQLVSATDAATGQTSSAELLRLAQEKLALYSARTIEIQSQLDEAIREGDVKATQDLTKQLLENQIAVQNNTKAVNEITGAGSAPASYTSTAWQWFRTAFLTGTGGVMPQYTSPVMADVSSIGPNATSSTTNNGKTITNNFEINEVGQPLDTTKLASTVVFAQSTAQ